MKKPNLLERAYDIGRYIDQAIGVFAPEAELARIKSRMTSTRLRSYEASKKGRRTENWRTPNMSVNDLLRGGLPTLRARARDLSRNNPWGVRAINTIATNAVGSGIIPQARAMQAGQKKIARSLEEAWIEWGDETICDNGERMDFYGIQNLAMRTIAESGSVLIRRRRRMSKDSLPVPIQLEVLEPDFLDTKKDGNLTNGNRIVHGVEFDRLGRRVAYHLYPEHPHDRTTVQYQSKRVPAADILHIFHTLRAGQADGVPWGASCILRLRDLDEFEDAQLIQQKIASCFVAFVHDIESLEDITGDEDRRDALERFEPGVIEHLEPGKTVTFGQPPSAEEGGLPTRVLRSVAAGYGVTYEALTGDYSQVNFSSARMGWLEFQRNLDVWQNQMIIPLLCKGVWRWFVEAANVAGRVSGYTPAVWTPPRREMIDPVKETNALSSQVKNGFTSRTQVIKQLGRDPADVYAEIAEDNKLADEKGLAFENDTRKTASS